MNVMNDILEKIQAYDTIIIHRHQNPDPDAIGSQVGLRDLLRAHFPQKRVLATGYDEPTLTWLAEMDEVKDEDYEGALVKVIFSLRLTTIQMMMLMVICSGSIPTLALLAS